MSEVGRLLVALAQSQEELSALVLDVTTALTGLRARVEAIEAHVQTVRLLTGHPEDK